jgi:hypothetical protein
MNGKELFNLIVAHRATLTIDDLILLNSEIAMQLGNKYLSLKKGIN